MDEKSCFFIGHSDSPESIKAQLAEAIEHHITEYGVDTFYIGGYGNFDRMAIAALQTAKCQHPNISLYLLLPYHPAEREFELPKDFTDSYYPFEAAPPRKFAIVKANELAIRKCRYLIAYAHHIGKARDFVSYAEKHGCYVTNIET